VIDGIEEVRFDGREDGSGFEGLQEHLVEAKCPHCILFVNHRTACQRDDGSVAKPRITSDEPEDFHPVDDWKPDVQQDDIWPGDARCAQSGGAITRSDDFESGPA
jgi:hypothetical protein